MPKFKELMRLKFEAKLPHRAIARAIGVGPGTVSRYAQLMEAAGLRWPLAPELNDDEIEQRLFPRSRLGSGFTKTLPDFAQIHQALKRKGYFLVRKGLLLALNDLAARMADLVFKYEAFFELIGIKLVLVGKHANPL